ncbi:hypothetical protein EK21DRAFT_114356 [Setomelanomma holmii]|uniref:Uncharacterized protein n=1 Tax=Setomelanomma holmii TaxID=210430 RepID=A0A9P4H575_9PLEO|nr:hypothetical protein EK21DRAFT_114356 [Setomelanomma holmii]
MAVPTSTRTSSSRHTFFSFPREIRDDIYAMLLEYHTKIFIRASDTNTVAFRFLKRHLPYNLLLNRQFMQEVGEMYFERAAVSYDGTSIFQLKKFLDQFPDDMAWKNIRELELVGHAGERCAKLVDGTNVVPQTCAHDVAMRCPQLRRLTTNFSPDILAKPLPRNPLTGPYQASLREFGRPGLRPFSIYSKSTDRLDKSPCQFPFDYASPMDIEQKGNLLRVLENKKLVQLTLRFDTTKQDVGRVDESWDWEGLFAEYTAVLEEEAEKQERKLHVVREVILPKKYSWSGWGGSCPPGVHPLDWH